jgi:hypothetical protein
VADDFELGAYCYIDRMQPQYAAFVGTVTQGDLPIEGIRSVRRWRLGNHVFRVVDVAVTPHGPTEHRSSSGSSACLSCTGVAGGGPPAGDAVWAS